MQNFQAHTIGGAERERGRLREREASKIKRKKKTFKLLLF